MRKHIFRLLFAMTLVLLGTYTFGIDTARAEGTDVATLRILATGDLHGQVTAYDYETNLELPENGLSKLANLVEQKKEETGSDNTLLVDAGDFLYDYSTNYFYDNYPDDIQPILKAMKLMNYDYITLGNHEFDYPWDYLKTQLSESGMQDRVLVCNTIWHDSGKQVFAPSAIITKDLATANGMTVKVRIGLIGSTTNSISTRRGDYVYEMDALNNYDSIVAEAARLKDEEKVDIVVVILHGGIGSQTPPSGSDNIGYALTRIKTIDAIVTGHTHEVFPDNGSSDITTSSIDNEAGCINGKPVVATKSHARALGIIDLDLSVQSDGSVSVKSGTSDIAYVTQSTKEDSAITAMFLAYGNKLKTGADSSVYPIRKGITYNNYDTVLWDSNLYQLLNNAKIAYGIGYIAEYLPAYKNMPVISCTRNMADDNEPYILLKDTLSAAKISRVLSESSAARPSGYIQMYTISGKDLREWLEYNASIYATQGTTFKTLLKNYVSANPKVSTLLQESSVYNWNSQYVFDGISYTVDLTKKARYLSDGTLISTANKRIASLTYNGTVVTDTTNFVLVCDSGLPALSFLPKETTDSIKSVKDNATGKGITLDYIKKQSAFGSIQVMADYNWSLSAEKAYTFLLGTPKKLFGIVSAFSWNKGLAAETISYSFYKGTLPAVTQKINLIATQGRSSMNNEPVPVVVSASSKYAISQMKYLPGKITKTSDIRWTNAAAIRSNQFSAATNGIYTILVTDKKGGNALAYVTVDRYNKNTLVSPVLDKLTNRNTAITGTAVPYATLHVTIGESSYTAAADKSGRFSITIAPPKAFAKISAYAEYNGMKSATVTAAVRKTGPDAVQINKVTVGSSLITGTTDPDTMVYALIWTTVYVGKGQTAKYKASDFYNSKYKIAETDITVNPDTGAYSIAIPYAKSNMKIFVFAMDRFGVTSKSTMQLTTY